MGLHLVEKASFRPYLYLILPHNHKFIFSPGVIGNPSLSRNGITLSELETIGENGMVETHPRQVYRHAQRRLSDPLLAPERSNPRMSPFSIDVKVGIPINEPIGESGPAHQQVGYLQAEGEKFYLYLDDKCIRK